MNFGKGILLAFLFFILFIGTLAYLAMREDHSLVSETYYQDESHFTEKQHQQTNGNSLTHPPAFSFQQGILTITYADFQKVRDAKLHIFRPSDPSLDQLIRLKNSTDTTLAVPIQKWSAGLYRLSMEWEMDAKKYYVEKLINF